MKEVGATVSGSGLYEAGGLCILHKQSVSFVDDIHPLKEYSSAESLQEKLFIKKAGPHLS